MATSRRDPAPNSQWQVEGRAFHGVRVLNPGGMVCRRPASTGAAPGLRESAPDKAESGVGAGRKGDEGSVAVTWASPRDCQWTGPEDSSRCRIKSSGPCRRSREEPPPVQERIERACPPCPAGWPGCRRTRVRRVPSKPQSNLLCRLGDKRGGNWSMAGEGALSPARIRGVRIASVVDADVRNGGRVESGFRNQAHDIWSIGSGEAVEPDRVQSDMDSGR